MNWDILILIFLLSSEKLYFFKISSIVKRHELLRYVALNKNSILVIIIIIIIITIIFIFISIDTIHILVLIFAYS